MNFLHKLLQNLKSRCRLRRQISLRRRVAIESLEDRSLLSTSSLTEGGTVFGLDLNAIWEEFQNYQLHSEASVAGFESSNPAVQIAGASILVDAVAAGETSDLLADLQSLSMQVTATFGRFVSGWLPIDAIDELDA